MEGRSSVRPILAHPANKIVVMNADGTDPRTVIDDSTFKRHLDWIAH